MKRRIGIRSSAVRLSVISIAYPAMIRIRTATATMTNIAAMMIFVG